MLACQRHLFQLPDEEYYLNCAYMSPLLRTVEEAGMAGLLKKRNPVNISVADFFEETEEVKALFARLVNADASQLALIPSISYGVATVMRNLPLNKGGKALIVGEEFPSDYMGLKQWCNVHDKEMQVISAPQEVKKGKAWNEAILNAIDIDTTVVVMSHVHWTDGTLFDLEAIGKRCKEADALLVIDGTQSVGALPLDVKRFNIAALLCAGYKWLMGPYSTGIAYYRDEFNEGSPLEESWMNRTNARDFRSLTNYGDTYLPGAARYQVGEASNFILLPMLKAALRQLLEWQPGRVQAYCQQLTKPLITYLAENGFGLEEDAYRAGHLFGFRLAAGIDEDKLFAALQEHKVMVSVRGNSIRVSPHVYNRDEDIQALYQVLQHAQTQFAK